MKIILDTEEKTITLADGSVHDLNDYTMVVDTPAVDDQDEMDRLGSGYVIRKRGPFSYFTIRGSWVNK